MSRPRQSVVPSEQCRAVVTPYPSTRPGYARHCTNRARRFGFCGIHDKMMQAGRGCFVERCDCADIGPLRGSTHFLNEPPA